MFLQQLQEQFKGSGITESKYKEIANTFSDFVALIEDALFHDGERFRSIITNNQFVSLFQKIQDHYADYVFFETPDKVEIKYHGKILSRHSTGQRASALALFILAYHRLMANEIVVRPNIRIQSYLEKYLIKKWTGYITVSFPNMEKWLLR